MVLSKQSTKPSLPREGFFMHPLFINIEFTRTWIKKVDLQYKNGSIIHILSYILSKVYGSDLPFQLLAQQNMYFMIYKFFINHYTLAALIISANTPDAVTSAPAPAPFTTNGSSGYLVL